MLAQIHEHTQTKFVIILDEWHAIYRMDQDNEHAILMWIDFLRSLFKGPYAKDYIALAYMTGVLPIRRFTSESPLNNFYEYTVFNTYPIGQFYGFTESEVKSLCKKHEMNYDEMKRWYDGYLYQDQYMYNPNSVVKAIAFRNIIGYWNETKRRRQGVAQYPKSAMLKHLHRDRGLVMHYTKRARRRASLRRRRAASFCLRLRMMLGFS